MVERGKRNVKSLMIKRDQKTACLKLVIVNKAPGPAEFYPRRQELNLKEFWGAQNGLWQ